MIHAASLPADRDPVVFVMRSCGCRDSTSLDDPMYNVVCLRCLRGNGDPSNKEQRVLAVFVDFLVQTKRTITILRRTEFLDGQQAVARSRECGCIYLQSSDKLTRSQFLICETHDHLGSTSNTVLIPSNCCTHCLLRLATVNGVKWDATPVLCRDHTVAERNFEELWRLANNKLDSN